MGDPALVSLLGLSLLSGFILYFQDRIKKLGFTGVELRKAVQEMKDAEAHMKTLASATLELVEADEGGYKRPEWNRTRYEEAKEGLKRLVG